MDESTGEHFIICVCTKALWQTRKSFIGGHLLIHFSRLELHEYLKHDPLAPGRPNPPTGITHTCAFYTYECHKPTWLMVNGASGGECVLWRQSRLTAGQTKQQTAMLITCPLIQDPVRQGRKPPLRLPWLDFKQSLAVTYTVMKRHNSTVSQLFYVKSESLIKNPHGQMEAFNGSCNCAVIMRLWGGQLGLIPVTSCGTDITGEGTEEWSDRQGNVSDSSHVGKNRRMCSRAARMEFKGCFFIPVEALLVLRARLRRRRVTFPKVAKHLHVDYNLMENYQSQQRYHSYNKEMNIICSSKHINSWIWAIKPNDLLRFPPLLACVAWEFALGRVCRAVIQFSCFFSHWPSHPPEE